MEPLVTTRQVLTWLWMCSDNKVTNKWKKLGHYASGQFCLIFQILSFSVTTAFFIRFLSIDIEKCLFESMFVSGHFNAAIAITHAMQSRHKITTLFTQLSKIYRDVKNAELKEFLIQANNTSEWMWALFFQYMSISFIGIAVVSIASVLLCRILHGIYDVEYFFYLYHVVLPWDQESLLGYFAESCFDIIAGMTYYIINGVMILLYISICIHHQAFYEMVKHSIDEWTNNSNKNENNEIFLRNLIRFHISAKELFLESAIIYSPIMVVQLVCSIIALAVTIFNVDLQLHHTDYTVASLLITGSSSMLIMFFYCYFGKLATLSFERMTDNVFEMNWQDLPIGLQKYFILMIANMQKPIYYYGGGIVILDLNTFINLFRRVITSYLMFKTIIN